MQVIEINDKQKVVERLLGEIDVHDLGICKINKNGIYTVYKVLEEDDSINWYVAPNDRSDTIIDTEQVDFVRER